MGADIHVHVEVKIGKRWHHLSHPHVMRNYQLFAKIAGVREHPENPIEPIVPPGRGLPKNMTKLTKLDYERWGDDAHTAGYLNRDELEKLSLWFMEKCFENKGWDRWPHGLEGQFGYLRGNPLHELGSNGDGPMIDDVRVIYWFDC